MKIPKYIDNALKQRTKYAIKLDKACAVVDRYLSAHDIDADDACWLGGVEIYANPKVAEEEVRIAIMKKE